MVLPKPWSILSGTFSKSVGGAKSSEMGSCKSTNKRVEVRK